MKKFLQYTLMVLLGIGFAGIVFAVDPEDPLPAEEPSTPKVEQTIVGFDEFCDGVTKVCPIGQVCEQGRCINSLKSTGAGAAIQPNTDSDYGLSSMGQKLGYSTSGVSKDTLLEKVGVGIRVVLGLLGSLVLLMMIYNGFLWMTARGNAEQVEKVKDSMMNLFIGLIIVLAAYAVSSFVLTALVNINK